MDAGACFGCGLGINVPLESENEQILTWQSGKPNPFPSFKLPDHFYTPTMLPGLYLPVGLIAPYNEDCDILYQPLPDSNIAYHLVAFAIHESIHQILLRDIIPTTMRLAAAKFYTGLVTLMKGGFDSDLWRVLNHINFCISAIHDTTKTMHEVAAIVENQITTPLNNPYIQTLSAESANQYAIDYGSEFIRYYRTFHLLITTLKEHFFPTPLHRLTIIALADYIISSAIDLIELANDIIKLPSLIPDTALQDYMEMSGIPYLEVEGGNLKESPYIQIGFGGFKIYGIWPRLDRTMSALSSTKFKRQRQISESYLDQLLYIAELVPELKLWLRSIEARHWVKRRMLDLIADHQAHLEQSATPLPLTQVWKSDLTAFISMKIGQDDKNMRAIRVGREPGYFAEISLQIPHNYWIAYSIQEGEPVGVIFSPYCRDGKPLSPFEIVISTRSTHGINRRVRYLILFESLRMQLAEGCGLVCPFKREDSRCCGGADLLWQVYNLGSKAIEDAVWEPKQWFKPECEQQEGEWFSKMEWPHFNIPRDSNVFL